MINPVTFSAPTTPSLADALAQNQTERGIEPLPLETERLLQRIQQGGSSGRFLADAFISAYRPGMAFNHALAELNQLDAEGFRLFHQILHIRTCPGWTDDHLYRIEQQIQTLIKEG